MSGKTLIGKDQLHAVLSANTAVLDVASDLLALGKDRPELRERLQAAASRLLESGTLVNTAVGSVGRVANNGR